MGYLVLEEKIGRHITAFGEVVEEVKRAQQANYDEMQHDRILHWLTPIDQSELQNKLQSERLAGAGQWFLDLHMFQAWAQAKGHALCCTDHQELAKHTWFLWSSIIFKPLNLRQNARSSFTYTAITENKTRTI
jgi:hypothetical protein